MIQIHPEISPRAYKIFREILILIGFRAEAPIWNGIVGLWGNIHGQSIRQAVVMPLSMEVFLDISLKQILQWNLKQSF